ncbi:MAG: transcription termination/antitermination protein NusA [Patescibacteria group bacterium]|jgi:N utilization substance protein A|nr:transcription termination/antitermination protein NusA [Patescibacteria group bacterium]
MQDTTTTNAKMVRTEFAAAINQIANERKIPVESIYEAIRQALVSAFRKQYGPLDEEWYYYTDLNENTGEARIMKAPVLEMDEETLEVTKWDEKKSEDVTPAGFGRIAAQTAKQVILQKIRESEKDQIISEYSERIGEILTAQILRMDGRTVILDIGRGQGYMPPEEQMRGEFYRMNNRISVLVKEIRDTHKGKSVICSRADKLLVAKLFEREVPEVASGAVKIELIAREAGVRTKLAVKSTQEGVDPVGSCVGQRGVRVQEVIRELNNEKLDIIPYSEDAKLLLQAALAPAENLKIEINASDRTVVVTAPDDQLSLAIGRGGQNVRLAAKLTGYKITIKSAGGSVASHVTGDEEYEIDTFAGIEPETRTLLVEHKLTTLTDLSRFKDKWQAFEIADAQKKILADRVSVFEAEQAEYEKNNPRTTETRKVEKEE